MSNEGVLRIRPYRVGDHHLVVALNRYGLVAAGVPLDADVYAGDLDDVEHAYPPDRAVLIVGEVDGAVVAMGGLRPLDPGTCEILRMRVNPDHQGHGHGRAILAALERHARQLGYRYANLLTGPDQHPAIDLYTSAGYQFLAEEDHGAVRGVRLVKDLEM